MAIRVAFLVLHAVLLSLAATSFTVVPGFGNGGFECQYYRYIWQSGWGVPYQFPYSLPLVLTYLAAYAIGLPGYALVWRSGDRVVGIVGVLFCAIGAASFAYELTHWFSNHYGAMLFSAPIVC
jgi:hypothetical protein